MTTQTNSLAHLAQDMTAAAIAGQAVGLTVLLVEMQALSKLIPGAAEHDPAETLRHEAEVEADFDNMPV
ncbi:MAG: hypothetical protein A3D16_17125 [Rhodobacterales bacterium RIFCSPHIGHO2_02_FULL_62_130]|jgi:hypothetical protein|nr:MAG: hypothetical protein A3D16_17125 [Rhodobacterales bacterium RIFCSPHIGHO2_02_FULL_62_130]OHC60602.1 MAG: hypothetical protein A3E48_13755 [Rhodobacterales bacterium RIFCSPHIGHO2_12_FULL_62_75]